MSDTTTDSKKSYSKEYYEKHKEEFKARNKLAYEKRKAAKTGGTPPAAPAAPAPPAPPQNIIIQTPLPTPRPKDPPLALPIKKDENMAETKLKLFILTLTIKDKMREIAELQQEQFELLKIKI